MELLLEQKMKLFQKNIIKNKYSLQFLKQYGISMSYIPYDYAIFAELKKQGEKRI